MALELAGTVMPAPMMLEKAEIRTVPPFDADVLARGFPPEVEMLRERIRRSDGFSS
jgi:chromate reductase